MLSPGAAIDRLAEPGCSRREDLIIGSKVANAIPTQPLGRRIVTAAQIVARRAGPPQSEPLVLIHGIGASGRIWDPITAGLAVDHDVIALDLPGFGESAPFPDGVASVPALSDAVARTMDDLGLERAHLAGNSMGGWIALELARRERALSVAAFSPAGAYNWAEALWGRVVGALIRLGPALLKPVLPRLLRGALGRRALLWSTMARGERISPEQAAALVATLTRAPGFWSAWRWLFAHRLEPLPRLEIPIVIAWGTRDRLLLPRQAKRFAELVPTARPIELAGLGHVPMSDDPEVVAAAIRSAVNASHERVE